MLITDIPPSSAGRLELGWKLREYWTPVSEVSRSDWQWNSSFAVGTPKHARVCTVARRTDSTATSCALEESCTDALRNITDRRW